MAFSSVTIIYNPNSTGPSQVMAEKLAAKLADYPAPVRLVGSKRAGHAEELAEAAAREGKHPLVISSSGDGGYHEVVNGVMKAVTAGHDAAAAVLPGGNGNDHRRAVGRGPLSQGILNDRTARIDLLRAAVTPPRKAAWVRYGHSYAGLGLTPLVAAELNRHDLNPLLELWIVLKAFRELRPVTIRTQDGPLELDSLILANIREHGKVLTFSKSGGPADGRFEVSMFRPDVRWRLLARLAKAAVLGLRPDEQLSRYAFETTHPTPMQLDGEVVELEPGTRVEITAAPRALETVL